MKVVTVRQPFASLIAIGAKTLLDEARPTGYRGRLLIRSAQQEPETEIVDGERLGSGRIGRFDFVRYNPAGESMCWPGTTTPLNPGDWYLYRRPDPPGRVPDVTVIPFGVVVASCELVDCIPILAYDAAKKADIADLPYPRVETIVGPSWNDDGELMVFHDVYGGADRYDGRLIINEAAFGDFSPGRWVWLLDDVRPTAARCPRCWGIGENVPRRPLHRMR